MKYSRVFRAMSTIPWMIQPEKLEAFLEVLALRMEGGGLTPEEISERTDHPKKGHGHETALYAVGPSSRAANRGEQGSPENIAVIPIYGVIMHRPTMDISSGGGFSIQRFRQQFQAAMENPSVSAIVLDVDSPGGMVDGVEEMAKEIYQARRKKKCVAIANTLAASAAYYLASSAEELAVTPSGEVGSIGVYMVHQDMSRAYDQQGITNTLIRAGKHKAEGNPWMPLDEESMASLQGQVDAHFDMFTRAVARNRGVSIETVRNGFGEGRTVMAKEAVKMGMADKVSSLDEILKALGASGVKREKAFGVAETPNIQAVSDDPESFPYKEWLRQRELEMF